MTLSEVLTPELADEFLSFEVGELVELYTLDATRLGGGVVPFTPYAENRATVAFGGVTYVPLPVQSEGWEWSSVGAPPEVTMSIGVVEPFSGAEASLVLAQIETYDDLIGAELRRQLTLARYLDGAPEEDPGQHFGFEIYRVEQKLSHTRSAVKFKLRSALDQEGATIPARRCTNRCSHRYRVSDGAGGFDYSRATCPYAGPVMADVTGAPVTSTEDDICGKLLRHCKLRFGANAELPFQGFPGVGRFIAR